MRKSKIPADEQYRLITECRQSGLSDYRWCKEHDINPGTFYNWVARLRRKGCAVPNPVDPDSLLPSEHQDVVKVDIVPDFPAMESRLSERSPFHQSSCITMRLEIAGCSLDISNGTDPALLTQIIRTLQGSLC